MKSLRSRIAIHLSLLVVGSLVIATGAAMGITRLHEDLNVAVLGYHELRQLYEAGFQVAAARDALAQQPVNRDKATASLDAAAARLQSQWDGVGPSAPLPWLNESSRMRLITLLNDASRHLQTATDSDAAANSVDQVLSEWSSPSCAGKSGRGGRHGWGVPPLEVLVHLLS